MNVVDYLILLTFLFALFDGWRRGAINLLFDLVALGAGILVAFGLYTPVGQFFGGLGLSAGLQPIVGFFATLIVVEWALRFAFSILGSILPRFFKWGVVGRLSGVGLGVVKQSILLALLINLLLFLPVIPQVRAAIQGSQLGQTFVVETPIFEHAFTALITPAIEELQRFTTVTKITDEAVELDTPVESLRIDAAAEQELFRLVNRERRERGLRELQWSDDLADVGRVHSKDMWTRQYFAHINPDGQTPFDRLDAYGITYVTAGENLALAPTTPIAHQGLMDSLGHRENILNPDFGTLGIGAVRNGLYGVMYTQLFTN